MAVYISGFETGFWVNGSNSYALGSGGAINITAGATSVSAIVAQTLGALTQAAKRLRCWMLLRYLRH
jgi:hypothetical protein